MRNADLWLSFCALLALTLTADSYLSGSVAERAMAAPAARDCSVAANLAGQFRTVIANVLWIRADRYHHEFVEHNGRWAQDSDILPLMRLITLFDPHFTQAYSAGAWMLGLYQGRPGQARSFLAEGLTHNPNSSDLHETMGILSLRCDGNLKAAVEHFRMARDHAETAFDQQRLSRSVRLLEERRAVELRSGQPLRPDRRSRTQSGRPGSP